MSKYIGHESGLIGPVTMQKPHPIIDEADTEYWHKKVNAYNQHLSSLPVIPCEGWVPVNGQEYVEGVDFKKVKSQTKSPSGSILVDPVNYVAVPLPLPLPAANDGGEKERCEFEKCIIKYFGLPEDIDFNTDIRVSLAILTDLLCAYKQSQSPAPDGWVSVEKLTLSEARIKELEEGLRNLRRGYFNDAEAVDNYIDQLLTK